MLNSNIWLLSYNYSELFSLLASSYFLVNHLGEFDDMLRQLYHNKEFLCFYHLFIRIIRSHCKEMLHVNLLKVKWKGFPSSDSMINFFISLGTGDKLLKVAGSQVEDAQKWIETWLLYFVHRDLNCCLPGMKTYKQFLSVFFL